mmetsp:Transcript_24384/g.36463  ORF Transcript_24384/g.36463 Transcript_24384/m.36463 type:complete len:141 (-) Transcript_24384:505-927(-)
MESDGMYRGSTIAMRIAMKKAKVGMNSRTNSKASPLPSRSSRSSSRHEGGGGGGAAAAPEEEAAAPVAEKTHFTVKLNSFDAASKIKLIKEVRALTGLGLKEAKDIVEKVPSDLKADVKKEEAEAIKEKLEAVGGTVVLE